LQSLDDLEATYREKNRVGYKGYVANVTETCDPQNPLQLITAVQVARTRPKTAPADRRTPEFKQRTNLDTLHTDAACAARKPTAPCAPRSDADSNGDPRAQAEHREAASGGLRHHPKCAGLPLDITGPQGQTVPVTPHGKPQRFAAEFASATCQTCPLYTTGCCPPQPDNRRRSLRLTFTQAEVEKAPAASAQPNGASARQQLTSAVESTVRSLKHPFPDSKLPVRGLFRMTCLIVAAAAMTNVRRIQRYRQRPRPAAPEQRKQCQGAQRRHEPTLAVHFSDTFSQF